MLRLGQVRAVPTRQSMRQVSEGHVSGRHFFRYGVRLVARSGSNRQFVTPSSLLAFRVFLSGVFFGAGTFPAVLGVSVLFRTRMRLFEQSVSIVVIWPDQVADTVDPPVVQNDFAAVFACSPVWDQTANSSHHRHRVRFGCFGASFFGAGTFSCGFWCSGSVSDTCHCSQMLLPSWLFGSISSPTQQLLRLLRYLATHGNVTKRYRCKRGGSEDCSRSPGCQCTSLVEGVATGHPKFWFASHRFVSEAGSLGRFHLVVMTTCLSFQWFRVQAVL